MSELAFTKLKLIQGYKFKAEFDAEGIPDLMVDESSAREKLDFSPKPKHLLWVKKVREKILRKKFNLLSPLQAMHTLFSGYLGRLI